MTIQPPSRDEMFAAFESANPSVEWRFQRSAYVPDDEVVVLDPNEFERALRPRGTQRRLPYVILAARGLTLEQQAAAMSLYFDKLRETASEDLG